MRIRTEYEVSGDKLCTEHFWSLKLQEEEIDFDEVSEEIGVTMAKYSGFSRSSLRMNTMFIVSSVAVMTRGVGGAVSED